MDTKPKSSTADAILPRWTFAAAILQCWEKKASRWPSFGGDAKKKSGYLWTPSVWLSARKLDCAG
eukprot:scaffold1757_cov266-Pinguiococcus_pyrenoidosus.AAC.13